VRHFREEPAALDWLSPQNMAAAADAHGEHSHT
jgi:hypothetical protein